MYKEIWTSKQNEYLNVRSEPENPPDKYAVCVLKDADIVAHLKKGDTGRFSKTIFLLSSKLFGSLVRCRSHWKEVQSG